MLHECGEFNTYDVDALDSVISDDEILKSFEATDKNETMGLQRAYEMFENVKKTVKTLYLLSSLQETKASKDKLIKFVV